MPTALLDDDRLDQAFAALANSTRRTMLARLADGPATVNDLAEPFDLSLPTISKHLQVLEHAGLIVRGRRAQYRPCSLDPDGLRAVADWLDACRPVWEASFDRLGDHLRSLSTPDHDPQEPDDA